MMLNVALAITTFLVLSMMFSVVYAFTFKIIVNVEDASSSMGKMKVKVTVKDKNHSSYKDKGVTKSKTVDIGKLADKEDWDEFKVAEFKFKDVKKGDKYIACVAKACHDSTTIKEKTVREYISLGRYREN